MSALFPRPRLHPLLEAQLRRALRRWRWLDFARNLGLLACATWAAILLLGVALQRGWLHEELVAYGLMALLVALGGIAFLGIAVLALARRRSRGWAARVIEELNPGLRDRLNALVFLEPKRADPEVAPYFRRIEEQARDAVPWGLAPTPFSARQALGAWILWLLLVAATIAFYSRTNPFAHIGREDGERSEVGEAPAVPAADLPKDAAEVKAPAEPAWAEVRITEPGRDLQVTKVDVVPLQIEAASSEPLTEARWFTAAASAPARPHALPPPAEPHYAVYKPLLYVDEQRLSDWDVLTYYASASTRPGGSYASEVYFLEVRPFREDILKMTGGEGSAAYQLLSELSGLIEQQKRVVRETHRHLQTSYARPQLARQDRDKLALAESDVREAARHLYARIAAEMENADVAVVLDQLARAAEALESAVSALRGTSPPLPPEQQALAELVATRKVFQKALASGRGEDDTGRDPEELVTAELTDKLKEVAEFRDEHKAVDEALRELVERQKRLAAEAARSEPSSLPGLAAEEDQIRGQVRELGASHRRAWKGAEKEAPQAEQALERAASAMRDGAPGSAGQAEAAGRALDALRKAVGRKADEQGLAEAYRLRRMLDAHARSLERVEQSPESFSEGQVAGAAGAARDTTRELKKLVEETPTGGAFGAPLRGAVGDEGQRRREEAFDSLARARAPDERRRAATAGRDELRQLSDAFDRSAPGLTQDLKKKDRLSADGEDALNLALRQLESLAAAAERGRPSSTEDAEKQRREAIANLEKGARALYGKDRRAADLLLRAQKELKARETKLEAARLRSLLEQIERFRVEMSERREAKDEPRVRHIDASSLPPAYRERIQRYFQQLSEQERP